MLGRFFLILAEGTETGTDIFIWVFNMRNNLLEEKRRGRLGNATKTYIFHRPPSIPWCLIPGEEKAYGGPESREGTTHTTRTGEGSQAYQYTWISIKGPAIGFKQTQAKISESNC